MRRVNVPQSCRVRPSPNVATQRTRLTQTSVSRSASKACKLTCASSRTHLSAKPNTNTTRASFSPACASPFRFYHKIQPIPQSLFKPSDVRWYGAMQPNPDKQSPRDKQVINELESANEKTRAKKLHKILKLFESASSQAQMTGLQYLSACFRFIEKGQIEEVKAIPVLLSLLSSQSHEVVLGALKCLTLCASEEVNAKSFSTWNGFGQINTLLGSPLESTRLAALNCLKAYTQWESIEKSMMTLQDLVTLIINFSESVEPQEQELACWILANISIRPESKEVLRDRGAITSLLKALKSKNEAIYSKAIVAVANLAFSRKNAEVIIESDGIQSIMRMFTTSSAMAQANACYALGNLIDIPQGKQQMRDYKLFQQITKLLESPDPEIQEFSTWSLSRYIHSDDAAKAEVGSYGAVKPLVALLDPIRVPVVVSNAANTLTNLIYQQPALQIQAAKAGAIPRLIEILERGSSEDKSFAALALGSLAASKENSTEILSAGVIPTIFKFINDQMKSPTLAEKGLLAFSVAATNYDVAQEILRRDDSRMLMSLCKTRGVPLSKEAYTVLDIIGKTITNHIEQQ